MARSPISIAALVGAGIIAASGGGGPPATGITRALSPTNWMAGAVLASASSRTKTCGNWPVYIGSGDARKVRVLVENFAVGTANIQLPGNTFTYDEMYLVSDATGQAVPVLFGGSPSRTLADGEAFVFSDPILPSAFGLSKFTRDSKFYIRYGGGVPANGNKWCKHNFSPAYAQFGMYSHIYDPAVTTITNINGSGAFTYTGTAPTNDRFMSVKLVGEFVSGDPLTYGGIGDSIMQNVGDMSGSNITQVAAGFFTRALWSVIGVSGARGGINFGMNAGLSGLWTTAAATLNQYLALCNTFIEEYGTNNFPTQGAANTGSVTFQVNAVTAVWAQILANAPVAGGQPIRLGRTKLGPRTTGAWALADGSDQSVWGPMWDAGGDVDLFMDTLAAKVGTPNSPQTLINLDSAWRIGQTKGQASYYKWQQAGTTDGTHPAPATAEAMAVITRSWMAAREAEALAA